jgi:hypothetical protein
MQCFTNKPGSPASIACFLCATRGTFCVCILAADCRQPQQTHRLDPGKRKLKWIRNNLCIIQSSFKEGARLARGAPGDASGAEVDAPRCAIKCIIYMRRRAPAAGGGEARWRLSVSAARLLLHALGNAGNAVHFALAVASNALSALPGARGASQARGESEMYGRYWRGTWCVEGALHYTDEQPNTTVVCGVF